MNNEKTITLDNVTMHRLADGTIIITVKKGRGCVTAGLMSSTAIVALLGGIATITNGVIPFFKPEGKYDSGVALFGFFVVLMFGGYAYYLYLKMRLGQKKEPITITPTLDVIKIGDRTIPFNDVADISAVEAPSIMLEGAVTLMFLLALSDGNVLELGRVVVEKGSKSDQRKAETLSFLKQAIQRS